MTTAEAIARIITVATGAAHDTYEDPGALHAAEIEEALAERDLLDPERLGRLEAYLAEVCREQQLTVGDVSVEEDRQRGTIDALAVACGPDGSPSENIGGAGSVVPALSPIGTAGADGKPQMEFVYDAASGDQVYTRLEGEALACARRLAAVDARWRVCLELAGGLTSIFGVEVYIDLIDALGPEVLDRAQTLDSAQDLAALLEVLDHQAGAARYRLRPDHGELLTETLTRAAPVLFQGGRGRLPTAPVMYDALGDLMHPDRFCEHPDLGLAVAHDHGQSGHVICFIVTDLERYTPAILPGLTAWEIVKQFDLPTARMHLIFGVCAMRQQGRWWQSSPLSGHYLASKLGFDRRKDARNKSEQLWEVARRAGLLGQIRIDAKWHQGRRNFTVSDSPLWHLSTRFHGAQLHLFERATLRDLTVSVHPGDWGVGFLDASAWSPYTWLAEDAFRFPAHQEMAGWLALALPFLARLDDLETRGLTVRALLEAAGGSGKVAAALGDRRAAYELTRRLQSALYDLERSGGWEFICDLERYPELQAIVPDRPQRRPEPVRPFEGFWTAGWNAPARRQREPLPRGYFPRLLDGVVRIVPPAYLQGVRPTRGRTLTAGRQAPAAAAGGPAVTLSGDRVRKARQAAGLSQADLGRRVGVSQQQIDHIEHGRRRIMPHTEERLRRHLAL